MSGFKLKKMDSIEAVSADGTVLFKVTGEWFYSDYPVPDAELWELKGHRYFTSDGKDSLLAGGFADQVPYCVMCGKVILDVKDCEPGNICDAMCHDCYFEDGDEV